MAPGRERVVAGQDSSSVSHMHFGVATCTEGKCGRQASLKSHQVILVSSHVLEPQGWTVGTLQSLCIPRALCSPRSWSERLHLCPAPDVLNPQCRQDPGDPGGTGSMPTDP